MSTGKKLSLTDDLYKYLLSVSLHEPEILLQLRQETANHPRANMQVAPEQGQFLAFLVKLIGAKFPPLQFLYYPFIFGISTNLDIVHIKKVLFHLNSL